MPPCLSEPIQTIQTASDAREFALEYMEPYLRELERNLALAEVRVEQLEAKLVAASQLDLGL